MISIHASVLTDAHKSARTNTGQGQPRRGRRYSPDGYDEGGYAARWRPRTHQSLTSTYARWLGYLQTQGLMLDNEPPPNRVTPERLEA